MIYQYFFHLGLLFWQRAVGGAQRLVPVHVANQYCRTDFLFDPTPKFDKKESLKDHRSINIYWGDLWFPLDCDSKFRLGVDFGVVKCL